MPLDVLEACGGVVTEGALHLLAVRLWDPAINRPLLHNGTAGLIYIRPNPASLYDEVYKIVIYFNVQANFLEVI